MTDTPKQKETPRVDALDCERAPDTNGHEGWKVAYFAMLTLARQLERELDSLRTPKQKEGEPSAEMIELLAATMQDRYDTMGWTETAKLVYTLATEGLRAEKEAAEKSRDFTRQWYAERLKWLQEWFRSDAAKLVPEEIRNQFWSIIANGTPGVGTQPTYQQLLNLAKHRAEAAEQSLAEQRKDAERGMRERCALVAMEHVGMCVAMGDSEKARTAGTIADAIRSLPIGSPDHSTPSCKTEGDSQWIPCSERLPEVKPHKKQSDSVHVVFIKSDTSVYGGWVDTAIYGAWEFYDLDGERDDADDDGMVKGFGWHQETDDRNGESLINTALHVTHWMPLPPAPEHK